MPISPKEATKHVGRLDMEAVEAAGKRIDQLLRGCFNGTSFRTASTLEGASERALFDQYEANGWKVERVEQTWVFTPKVK